MFAIGLVLAVLGVLGVAVLVALYLEVRGENKHADGQRDQIRLGLGEGRSS